MKLNAIPLAFCCGLLSTAPLPFDDCAVSGPYIDTNGPDAPIIIDNGSTGTSHEAGCDGCGVDFDVTVIWQHFGNAAITLPDGSIMLNFVSSGETTNVETSDSMACDGFSQIDIISEQGGGYVKFECSACR